jgi:hypothetical protein
VEKLESSDAVGRESRDRNKMPEKWEDNEKETTERF